jgi:hypothetical protein
MPSLVGQGKFLAVYRNGHLHEQLQRDGADATDGTALLGERREFSGVAGLTIENRYDDVPADPKAPSFK